MIEHIVLFKLKIEHQSQLEELERRLQELESKIEVIKSLETGRNFAERPDAYDLLLKVMLESKEDLHEYAVHPDHQEVLKFIKEITQETAVVDFIK